MSRSEGAKYIVKDRCSDEQGERCGPAAWPGSAAGGERQQLAHGAWQAAARRQPTAASWTKLWQLQGELDAAAGRAAGPLTPSTGAAGQQALLALHHWEPPGLAAPSTTHHASSWFARRNSSSLKRGTSAWVWWVDGGDGGGLSAAFEAHGDQPPGLAWASTLARPSVSPACHPASGHGRRGHAARPRAQQPPHPLA